MTKAVKLSKKERGYLASKVFWDAEYLEISLMIETWLTDELRARKKNELAFYKNIMKKLEG